MQLGTVVGASLWLGTGGAASVSLGEGSVRLAEEPVELMGEPALLKIRGENQRGVGGGKFRDKLS